MEAVLVRQVEGVRVDEAGDEVSADDGLQILDLFLHALLFGEEVSA